MFSWWNLFENGGFSKTWWKPGDFFKIHEVFTRFWKITKLKQIVENVVIFQNPVKTWWILKKSPGFHQVFENRDFEKPCVFVSKNHQVFTRFLNITKCFKALVKTWCFFKILLWCAWILFVEIFERSVFDSWIYLQNACWVLELKLLRENASSALSLTPKQLNSGCQGLGC